MERKDKLISNDLLKPENMLRLYASGSFPMADSETGQINWFMPETRCIIPFNHFKVPRSAAKAFQKLKFDIRFDENYLEVINHCVDREETWISEKLIDGYRRLFRRGHIHSAETYLNDELVGGLYGVTFRGAFFGESMFSKVSEASKFALTKLIERLSAKGFLLLDVQYMTEHLKMFGAIEISWDQYQELLREAYLRNCEF